jgi:hypothetical protein
MGERVGSTREERIKKFRKPEGKRQLGSPKCRWKDNITITLKDVGWTGVD